MLYIHPRKFAYGLCIVVPDNILLYPYSSRLLHNVLRETRVYKSTFSDVLHDPKQSKLKLRGNRNTTLNKTPGAPFINID